MPSGRPSARAGAARKSARKRESRDPTGRAISSSCAFALSATLVLLPLLPLASGCAAIYTQTHSAYLEVIPDCSETWTFPNVYSGSTLDLSCIPAENAGFFCLVDLPLSLVVDTLILPFTAYRQIHEGNWYDQQTCLERTDTKPAPEKESLLERGLRWPGDADSRTRTS